MYLLTYLLTYTNASCQGESSRDTISISVTNEIYERSSCWTNEGISANLAQIFPVVEPRTA